MHVDKSTLDAAAAVLRQRPSALVTDIDGTLSRIVPKPEDATVEPEIRVSLSLLSRRLSLVAIVTARPKAVAEKMVGVPGLHYVGHYGLAGKDGVAGTAEIERMKLFVKPELGAFPCVIFEDKGLSFAVHYRTCAEPEEVRLELLRLLEPVAKEAGARLVEGKRVIEMVPGPLPDKGDAVRKLQREFAPNGMLYFGDDLGDLAVFREVRRRREEEGLPSLGVAVVDDETDARILAAADRTVNGVDGVRDMLAALASGIELPAETSHA
jgi:trehalose 6-phosphate phosphatase